MVVAGSAFRGHAAASGRLKVEQSAWQAEVRVRRMALRHYKRAGGKATWEFPTDAPQSLFAVKLPQSVQRKGTLAATLQSHPWLM